MIFKLTPHIDIDTVAVDVQYTKNPFGAWTALVTDDSITNYPKKFSSSLIDENTYIRFRLKNSDLSYTDWSESKKPCASYQPEANKNLCYVYGRLYNLDTNLTLNSPIVSFEYVSGTPTTGHPLIRKISVEGDNYGWFIVSLTKGIVYKMTCLDASLEKNITIPSAYNVNYESL